MEDNKFEAASNMFEDLTSTGKKYKKTLVKGKRVTLEDVRRKLVKPMMLKKRVPPSKRKQSVDGPSSSSSSSNSKKTSASQKKVKKVYKLNKEDLKNIQGYRFMDMQILQDMISDLCCPQCCKTDTLYVEENINKKKELSPILLSDVIVVMKKKHTLQ